MSLKDLYIAYCRAVNRFQMTRGVDAKKAAKKEADAAWDRFDDEVTKHLIPPQKMLEKA